MLVSVEEIVVPEIVILVPADNQVTAPVESSQKSILSPPGSESDAPVPPLARDKSAPLQSPLFIDNVPPRVMLPVVVTVPVKVNPFTVPVPPTEVTVPVFVVYPLGFYAK